MFRSRFKSLRAEKKITQQELSEKIHIGRKTISDYERGISNPDLETLQVIASFFNVSTDYLLGKSDERKSMATSSAAPLQDEALIALYNQTEGLSKEQMDQVISYVQFLKSKESK